MSEKAYLKKRVAELEAQNNELRGLIFSTGAPIIVLNREMQVIQFTEAAETIYNLTEDCVGRSVFSIKTQVDDETLKEDIERVFHQEKTNAVEVESAQGRWYRRRIMPLIMGYETIDEVILIYDEITAIKDYQQEIERREEQLRGALDAVSDGIWVWNVKDGTTEVNARTAEIFGLDPDEPFPGTDALFSRVHEDDLPAVKKAIQAHICGDTPVYHKEFRVKLPGGEERWVLGRGRLLDYDNADIPLRMVGTNTDITEQKKASQQLVGMEKEWIQNRERLSIAADTAGIGVWEYDIQTGKLTWDDWMCRLYGLTKVPENLTYESWQKFVHPNDRDDAFRYVQNAIDGKGYLDCEFRITRADGINRYIKANGKVIRGKQGHSESMIGVNYDITEQVEAQETLKQQADVLNQIMDMVTVTDLSGRIIYVNESVCRTLGYSSEELIGKYSEKYGESIEKSVTQKSILETTLKNGVWRGEVVNYDKNGREILVDCRTQIVRDAKSNPIALCGVSTDITERRQAEKELQKMEKLQSVGLLAGGVAHDFNNILMGLFGNIEHARHLLEEGHPARESLLEAEKSMERATNLTTRLLTFAKGGSPLFGDVDLEGLTKDIVLFDLSGSNIRAVFDIAEDLWFASVDKVQIQQVISNLTINAREAMPNAGCIYVSLRNISVTKSHVGIRPGKYVELKVRDEGEGIDDVLIDRIYDPYFTTKQTGSGLGLATVYSIVAKHGGTIHVNTEKGYGTEFVLLLPAVEKKEGIECVVKPNRNFTDLHEARILVMDDEDMICSLIKNMLQKIVKKVSAVSDGVALLREYESSIQAEEPYDAVIMDLTIKGGMGGKEAIKELLKIDRDARVIVSSGYADDAIMSEFEDYGFKGVVVKPYKRQSLIDELQAILLEESK